MMMDINRLQPLECRQIRKLLDDFLCDELSVEVSRQILFHLDGCAGCSEEKSQRAELRELLRQAWNMLTAPTALTDSIRTMVEAEDPRISWMRLAAGFVLGLLGLSALVLLLTWFTGSTGVAVDHFAAAVEDHLRCSGKPVTESAALPVNPEAPRLTEALASLPPGFTLVGVMECEVKGASFVHYLFRGEGGRLLSIMLERREPGQQLAQSGQPAVVVDLQARTVKMGPVLVTGVELSRYFIYLIGDGMSQDQAQTVAERLLPVLQDMLG